MNPKNPYLEMSGPARPGERQAPTVAQQWTAYYLQADTLYQEQKAIDSGVRNR